MTVCWLVTAQTVCYSYCC